MSSPHDALFKAVFAQPEHARGALRSVLPAAVAEALDWPTLADCPGSFIDPALRGRHTDLLFSVAWRGGGDAPVYLLFEHQSSPDHWMAYRVLRYLVRIWERWRTDHPDAEALPVIIPVVLYHGAQPWSVPGAFEALFEIPEAVRPALDTHVVKLTYVIDDVSRTPDDKLRTRAMTALGLLVAACFKYARTRTDFLDILSDWGDVLREVARAPQGLEALVQVMRYILLVNDHVDPEQLTAFLERVAPEAKETIMTAGERLMQQGEERGLQRGIQQGVQQGLQQGVQQGIQQGERGVLLRLLQQRFGDQVDADVERRLAIASAEQLGIWVDRVLSAATLAELLSS